MYCVLLTKYIISSSANSSIPESHEETVSNSSSNGSSNSSRNSGRRLASGKCLAMMTTCQYSASIFLCVGQELISRKACIGQAGSALGSKALSVADDAV